MRYKIRNILCLTALALIMGLSGSMTASAQGVVTLAEETDPSLPALNNDIPDELSLFNEASNMDELGLPTTVNHDIPLVDNTAPAAEMKETAAPAPTDAEVPSPDARANPPVVEEEIGLSTLLSEPGAGIGALGGNDLGTIDDSVFARMSDLEKQTALLNLELRRERVKNEIEAIKNQRKLAVEQEQDKAEAKVKAKVEWEKAQEQKVLQEQQKLRELDIQFEKTRQEKLLNSYKNKSLEESQQWIEMSGDMYKKIEELNNEKAKLADDSKSKLATLKDSISSATNVAIEAKAAYQREISDLQTQLSVLKSRIEAQEREMEKQNPFAEEGIDGQMAQMKGSIEGSSSETKLSDLYAVMEIRGQGGELISKLINQEGMPFYVKKGTTLQSGHIIDDITTTYVRADRNGMKEYLYFAAGGILPLEPGKSDVGNTLKGALQNAEEQPIPQEFNSSDGVPGLGRDMMAR